MTVTFRAIKDLDLSGSNDVGQNIQNKYYHLLLMGVVRSTISAVNGIMRIHFNNDQTAGHYVSQLWGSRTATTHVPEYGDSYAAEIPGANSPAGAYGTFRAWIFDYNSSSIIKVAQIHFTSYLDNTLFSVQADVGIQWDSTNPITRINFYESGGNNFDTGSHVQIYGVGDAP